MELASPIVRLRAEALGDEGRRWLARLPALVAEMEARWEIRVGHALPGGTAAFVAAARTSTGMPVVLKIGVPDPALVDEIGTLQRAKGRGYVRLLTQDASRGAMLLEALGESLTASRLGPEHQLRILGVLATTAWSVPRAKAGPAPVPLNKAANLHALVDRLWAEVAPDCPVAARDKALACADRLAADFDPARCVVVHGDAAAANALRVLAPRAGAETGFVFVDPDGFVGDPAYDLGVALRDWCAELLASDDPQTLMANYVAELASQTGFEASTIRDWAYLERVSTGLHVLSLGAPDLGQPFLRSAAALL